MKKQSGFSLIELLVCVAILLVLAALIYPSIIASIQTGNESSAINTLQQVVTANNAYMQLYPSRIYAVTGSNFGGVVGATACPNMPDVGGSNSCLIPNAQALLLDGGSFSGYTFTYKPNTVSPPVTSWTLTAVPTSSLMGRKAYCVDSSGVTRYVLGLTAPTNTAGVACTGGTILGQ